MTQIRLQALRFNRRYKNSRRGTLQMSKLYCYLSLLFVFTGILSVFNDSNASQTAPAKARSATPSEYTFIAFDVAEGLSLLLKDGARGILFDVGNLQQAPHLLSRLEAHGVSAIDYIVLSHLHPDHASGLFRLTEAFPNAALIYNCHPFNAFRQPDLTRWVHNALQQNPQARCVSEGKRIKWQGAELNFLWPDKFVNDDLNYHSLVTQVSVLQFDLLLMGDANQHTEHKLLSNPALPRHPTFFVAGHHGAEDTLGEEFLQWIQPDYSIISINKNNHRGYPAPRVIEALKTRSQHGLMATYQQGEICFLLRETGVTLCP